MVSKHKFGTAEYKLEKCKEEIDSAIKEVEKLRVDSFSIQKFEPITFGKSFSSGRIEGNTNRNPDYFVNWGSYSRFEPLNESHITRSVEAVQKWIEKVTPMVEEWHAENLPKIENNIQARQNAENFMRVLGIEQSYSKYKYATGRQKTGKWETERAGFLDDLDRQCKTSDGYETALKALEDLKKKTEEWAKNKRTEIAKIQKEKEKSDRQIRLVAKAMELAAKWDISSKDNDELISYVTDRAKEEYLKENFPNGTEVYLKHACDSCSEWTVGEYRCSCGNRRIYLHCEGNILDGFDAWPEAD